VLDRLNRHDLTDEEWERLRVFLPADPLRGGRWADHRMVINGIFFRTRTGCPWRDLPEGFGNFMFDQMAGCQGLLLRASWP